ncbi:hypothetical protein ACFL17_09890 [Pseudomonadota bacterium]
MSPRRISISAWVYFAIALFAVLYAVQPGALLRYVSAVLIIVFLVLEFSATPRLQRAIALCLVTAGVIFALASGRAFEVALQGIIRSQIFLALFFAVSWLQVPASQSPSLRAARALAVDQPSNRRHPILAYTVLLLSSVLNLAGLSLMTSIVSEKVSSKPKKRYTLALMQGFTSAMAWSPFMVSVPVLLVTLPDLQWSDFAFYGFFVAVVYILVGWIIDRLFFQRIDDNVIIQPKKLPENIIWRLAGILIFLVVPVMGLVRLSGLPIPIALAIVVPPFALIWYRSMNKSSSAGGSMSRQVISGFPNLRSEVWIFVCANVFGGGVAGFVTPETVSLLLENFAVTADVALLVLPIVVVLLGVVGLHPMIPIIVIAELFSPEALGLRPWVMGLMLLSAWTLSVNVSPFSGVVLYMSRTTGESNYTIAWRWNLPFVMVAGTVVVMSVMTINYLF